ncbi:uncharacterized protein [Triticum aestivum]|uniref:uncharacterized protein isoform X3 n=1 Tax=Triticum aestivum TaxID=4565 RepID=UPI0008451AB3|nr:uncharacterized protein LOC123149579 isoform X3 [Triticum aestivum]
MTAKVSGCRKRGAEAFMEDPFAALPPLNAKRGRCSPSAAADVAELGVSMDFDPVDALQLIFPGADPQLLRGYFEASGNVLDAAIRGFKDYLASGSAPTNAHAASSGGMVARHYEYCSKLNLAVSSSCCLMIMSVASDVPVMKMNNLRNGTEWAELIVKEMSAASDLIDAKNRAFRILELFDKSAADCNTPDEKQKMREEHKILKQMLGGLLHQNGVLKRAFLIQHNRLKDYQDMVQERSQFKEIVDKYQQQIKALEDRNYVLSLHLAQSDHRSGISGHRNPDIF